MKIKPMKTLHCSTLKMFVLIIIFEFSGSIGMSQYLLKYPGTSTSYYDNGGNLGIGTTAASARLHIKKSSINSEPLFKTECINNLNLLYGSVQNCVSVNNQNYGIYQTSDTTSGLKNYFQDPLTIGNVTISSNGSNATAIATERYVNDLSFIMNPNTGPTTYPLSINASGIRVRSNLVTDKFQLLTDPGTNKILVSDSAGNASWKNPLAYSILTDYWEKNKNGDIYTDYPHVGIGTTNPQASLDIQTGTNKDGIVFNQTDTAYGCEIKFKNNDSLECALGYNKSSYRPSFFLWNGLLKKYEFYIDLRNGMTGLGTNWPSAKFEVAGDMIVKTKLGINCKPPTDPVYKLFVEGGIEARKIKVTVNAFPDYCFKDDYNLMSLPDLKNFIALNKHLPDVPTAQEVEKNNGIEIGEMQTILVKKMEEQTLYILDLQRQINELKSQLERLTAK